MYKVATFQGTELPRCQGDPLAEAHGWRDVPWFDLFLQHLTEDTECILLSQHPSCPYYSPSSVPSEEHSQDPGSLLGDASQKKTDSSSLSIFKLPIIPQLKVSETSRVPP